MAKSNLDSTITIKFSPTDRAILKRLAKALENKDDDSEEFADTAKRLVEQRGRSGYEDSTAGSSIGETSNG